VWGIWLGDMLHLSIGSPTLAAAGPATSMTVHLDSGIDVVIVEGLVDSTTVDPDLVAAYDDKYTWSYDASAYGPLTSIRPVAVMAWRSAGWAGRDGFVATNRWRWMPD
jgi:acyl CoA:acetate/3-ketoacid CoA transferase beta subunit